MNQLLLTLLLLPMAGFFSLLFIHHTHPNNIRITGLWIGLLQWIVWAILLVQYNLYHLKVSFVTHLTNPLDVQWNFFASGFEFFILTIFYTVFLALFISSWFISHRNTKKYVLSLLWLCSIITGLVLTTNILILAVFFFALLVPLIVLTGFWGAHPNEDSFFSFSVYTVIIYSLFLVGIIFLYASHIETGYFTLKQLGSSANLQFFLLPFLFLPIAFFIPLWPFHLWQVRFGNLLGQSVAILFGNILSFTGLFIIIKYFIFLLPIAMKTYATPLFIWSLGSFFFLIFSAWRYRLQPIMFLRYIIFAQNTFWFSWIFWLNKNLLMGSLFIISNQFIFYTLLILIIFLFTHIYKTSIFEIFSMLLQLGSWQAAFVLFLLIFVSILSPLTIGFVGMYTLLRTIYILKGLWVILPVIGIVILFLYWRIFYLYFMEKESDTLSSTPLTFPSKKIIALIILLFIPIFAMGLWSDILLSWINNGLTFYHFIS